MTKPLQRDPDLQILQISGSCIPDDFGPYPRTLVPSKIAPLPTGSGTARMTRAEGLAASHTDISECDTEPLKLRAKQGA